MDIEPRSSLEQYERLAEGLVKAYRSGDSEAMQHIKNHTQRASTWDELREAVQQNLGKLPDSANRSGGLSLADAQLLVARWNDFESWPTLAEYAETVTQTNSPVSQFESAVDAVITGDVATLEQLLRNRGANATFVVAPAAWLVVFWGVQVLKRKAHRTRALCPHVLSSFPCILATDNLPLERASRHYS